MQATLSRLGSRARTTDFARLGLWLLFALGVMAVAAFFGLLAVTANPILIGMAAGLVVGLFLLMRADFLIWLILVLGLASGAFVSMLGPQFSKITWAVSLMGFVLLALALFNLFLPGRSRGQPAFVWIVLAFLLAGLATTMAQWFSTGEVIAGVKRMYQVFGLLFALAALALEPRAFTRFGKLLLAIALLQLPFAVYEFLFLVKERGGLTVNSATTDVVAGTFGANLEGGSPNSVMAIFLLIALAFLFARWKEKLVATHWLLILALPMVAVFFLGEVKLLFVLIPVAFLVLLKRDIPRRPAFFMLMSVFAILLLALMAYLYSAFIIREPIGEIIEDTLSYNVEERGYGNYYLNRLTVLEFWWAQQGMHDPVGFLFGNGLGSAFSAPSLVPGHVARSWPMYGIDLTAAASLLWDTGVIGFGLFVLMLAAAWRACSVLIRQSTQISVQADATAIQTAIALFGVFLFYNNSLVSHAGMQIILMGVLGYLAYLYRRHKLGLN